MRGEAAGTGPGGGHTRRDRGLGAEPRPLRGVSPHGTGTGLRPESEPEWTCYAIEINLRKGGTTAPYLTLEFLTRGRYVEERGLFEARGGRPKFYVSSDHVEAEAYRQLTAMDLFDVAMR